MNEMPPSLQTALVQEFVAKVHSNSDRPVELLAQEPALANATWDWGGGEWESGLDGRRAL
tara:strand:- start:447 stop:626 length:180 start_codon:yes stop_codon:yes gene_type:complete